MTLLNRAHVPHDVGIAAAALYVQQRILLRRAFHPAVAAADNGQAQFAAVLTGDDILGAGLALFAETESACKAFRGDKDVFLRTFRAS